MYWRQRWITLLRLKSFKIKSVGQRPTKNARAKNKALKGKVFNTYPISIYKRREKLERRSDMQQIKRNSNGYGQAPRLCYQRQCLHYE